MVICPGLHPLSPSAVPNTCTYIWKTIRERSLCSLGRRRREIMGTRKPETDDISASICSLIDIREEEEIKRDKGMLLQFRRSPFSLVHKCGLDAKTLFPSHLDFAFCKKCYTLHYAPETFKMWSWGLLILPPLRFWVKSKFGEFKRSKLSFLTILDTQNFEVW